MPHIPDALAEHLALAPLYLLIPALVVVGAATTACEAVRARLVRAALAVALPRGLVEDSP